MTVLPWAAVASADRRLARAGALEDGRQARRFPALAGALENVLAVLRVWVVWRRLAALCGLGRRVHRLPRRGLRRVVEDLPGGSQIVVARSALYLDVPRLSHWRVTPDGWSARVWLRPGDTLTDYQSRAEELRHGFRAGSVAIAPLSPGFARLIVLRRDPLRLAPTWGPFAAADADGVVTRVRLAVDEAGNPWWWDLAETPHALIAGKTGGGKSGWLAALVTALAPTSAALVGLDLKAGLELGLAARRLTVLATTPAESADVLAQVLALIEDRAQVCRRANVRGVADLPGLDPARRPVFVIVDEVAELLLITGDDKDTPKRLNVLLLRVAQLGRALGIHVVVAGQRFGSDLAPGVTSVRAQLGQRVVCSVADRESAVMGLGDVAPDAVDAALRIDEDLPGVAVVTGGPIGWRRVRSLYVPAAELACAASELADLTPTWEDLSARPLRGLESGEEAP
jgi:S-DNA-T family DNA segregation ATPase FtsK/SpoIIIE